MTALLADLAPIETFPTVDAMHAFAARLAAQHPDRVTVRVVGRSRQGDAIELLSIRSDGERGAVLVVGQPHPNEPIGMATIMTMCERLLADPSELEATGVSWHFIPCADPDGTRLNEGWFSGPWTRDHYARNFYRPGSEAQVEWTFPFTADDFAVDAPLPETAALMAAIDEVRPSVLASLHNGELGGAYYYASPGAEPLYAQLAELCIAHNVPLHRGEPETPLSVELAPAVYTVPTARQLYDFARAAGLDVSTIVTGASSLDYAERYGPVFGVVVELPYWRDGRAADTTPCRSGDRRRTVVLHGLDLQETAAARIHRLYEAAAPVPPSPFADAVMSFLRMTEGGYLDAERHEAQTNPDFDRPTTVAEAFSAIDSGHMFRLRLAGMLLRALPPDAVTQPAVESTFAEWAAEAAADNRAESIPISDLVAVQGGAILAAVRFWSNQPDSARLETGDGS